MLMFRGESAEATLAANDYAMLVNGVLTPKEAFSDEVRAAYITAWSQPGALTGGLNYYRAARVGPPTTAAPRDAPGAFGGAAMPVISVPTLVIWGERDTALLTGNLDGLDQLVRNLTVVRVPEATHWIVHEVPERVNAAIRDFLG